MSNASRILIALGLGLLAGIIAAALDAPFARTAADLAEPVGALWLNGLRMTIVPLVVALLVTGIAQSVEAARAGRVAARTLVWIIALMTGSAIMGAVLTPALLAAWPMPAEAGAALKAALVSSAKVAPVPPFGDFLRSIVPTNPIAAAASDAILPLIIFTGVFAMALTRLAPEPRALMTGFFAALADAMVIVIEWVLKIAPVGVAALAFVVGARSGAAALGALLHYVAILSAVGVITGLTAYPVAVLAGRIPLLTFAREVAPVQALAISTQSSLACLPLMLRRSAALGVPDATARLVLPMAVALLRVTGPAMNLSVALYVAHWYGVPLGAGQWTVAIIAAVLTSMGAVSLPGQVSFVTSIAPISLAIGVPIEPLALLIAVETVPDIFRTLGNAQMDVAVATAVAARERP